MDVMSAFAWLADAPLFIDDEQVARFHDAVLQPDSKEGTTKISLDKESVKKLGGKLTAGIEASPGGLGKLLTSLFNFKATINAGGEVAKETKTGEAFTVELHPIDSPQRQLVQIALHYLANYGDRLAIVVDPSSDDWRKIEYILYPPRALAFIDVPNGSKILPLAAEYANGTVVSIFEQFKAKDGGGQPAYPQAAGGARQDYWKWFADNFNASQAMAAVEETAKANGRIQWIAYRIFLDDKGNTLHLHINPNGKYDTGTFAYDFIKRGNRHGIRLVGTLKSEPAMNVLAIYEK